MLRKGAEDGVRALKSIYWFVINIGYRGNFFSVNEIPIIINNFNRLAYLQDLLRFLNQYGFTNIIIIDNNSTYVPLMEFYKDCPYKVYRLQKNYGHLAFWHSNLYYKYRWNYFVYTDPDVLPIDQCPKDFLKYFKTILDKNYRIDKVGFGIKIDDLPDSFTFKEKVVSYELGYWKKEVKPNIFEAPIDTTFALYKPLSNLKAGHIFTLSANRTGFPYLIRHLPWYIDSGNLSEEERYYMQTSNSSSTIGSQARGDVSVY